MAQPQRTFSVARSPGVESPQWLLVRLGISAAVTVALLLHIGFHRPILGQTWLRAVEAAGLAALWTSYLYLYVTRADRNVWLRYRMFEVGVLTTATFTLAGGTLWSGAVLGMLSGILFIRLYVLLAGRLNRPGLLLVASFALLTLAGTVLIKLPAATPMDHPISLVDALFTATSAVCVTGLVVRDTATEFTPLGQAIILILVQLGGLGIAIFGALFARIVGGSMSLRYAASVQELVPSAGGGLADLERLVRFVVAFTFGAELLGAFFLWLGWREEFEGFHAIHNSLFVSISAFCNAGFAPFTDNLVRYRYHWTTHGPVTAMVFLGGIGFPVLYNLTQVLRSRLALRFGTDRQRRWHRDRIVRVSLHTKIVLTMTAVVYLGGTVLLLAGQLTPYLHRALGIVTPAASAEPLPPLTSGILVRDALDASFMCIVSRTAGFNSVDMTEMETSSRFVMMLLMWIGGSPGSTAGGVKTVAVATLLLSIWATVRGRSEIEAFGRSIPEDLVRRAGVLAMSGFFVISAATLALTLTEPPRLADQLFEVVSAAGTVGLSLGLTDDLSVPGRLIIAATMFLGRVGPLALLSVLVFSQARSQTRYAYPTEPVVMS